MRLRNLLSYSTCWFDFPAAYFLSKFFLQMAAHILSVQLWRQNKEIVH